MIEITHLGLVDEFCQRDIRMRTIDVYSLEPTSGSVLESEAEEVTDVRWGAPSELDDKGRSEIS